MRNKMLSLREAAVYLSLEPEEVENLVKAKKLPAYKIGGTYLRFRYNQVAAFKQGVGKTEVLSSEKSLVLDRLKDFWYFGSFYIISAAIVVILILLILKS